jgi:pseudouridine synthase
LDETGIKVVSSGDFEQERLQKVLARAGIASRRACEELISAGRVKVNGKLVTQPGTKINPAVDKVTVDGNPVSVRADNAPRQLYLALNKPIGYLSTVSDPQGRPTIMDLLDFKERLFPVGRLDADSEGLIILTNDGAFANALMHPKNEVEKEYIALLEGFPRMSDLEILRKGVPIPVEDPQTGERSTYKTAPAGVELLRRDGSNTLVKFILTEGKKRQVRLMADFIEHPVLKLIRVRYGSLKLGDLAPGKTRKLTTTEVQTLIKETSQEKKSAPERATRPGAPESRTGSSRSGYGRRDFDGPPNNRRSAGSPPPSRRSGDSPSFSRRAEDTGPSNRRSGDRPPFARRDEDTAPRDRKFGDRPPFTRRDEEAPPGNRKYGNKPPFAGRDETAPPRGRKFGDRPPAARRDEETPLRSRKFGDSPPAARRDEEGVVRGSRSSDTPGESRQAPRGGRRDFNAPTPNRRNEERTPYRRREEEETPPGSRRSYGGPPRQRRDNSGNSQEQQNNERAPRGRRDFEGPPRERRNTGGPNRPPRRDGPSGDNRNTQRRSNNPNSNRRNNQ